MVVHTATAQKQTRISSLAKPSLDWVHVSALTLYALVRVTSPGHSPGSGQGGPCLAAAGVNRAETSSRAPPHPDQRGNGASGQTAAHALHLAESHGKYESLRSSGDWMLSYRPV